ncbi:MAG: c-type cytochrome [Acidobacteriia bacterium]|nr:c-type cytochrome [Terriglobia bacterium]
MRRFLLGLIVGLLAIPLGAFLYLRMGYAPVATAAPPLPFERALTSMALDARIRKEAPDSSPVSATEENLLAGAKIYRENCAVCHGLRDGSRTAIAKGMFPRPPELLHGKDMMDDPVGETYWKVKNGIRLTGMPGFAGSLTETEMWQVSHLVREAAKLPAPVGALLETK